MSRLYLLSRETIPGTKDRRHTVYVARAGSARYLIDIYAVGAVLPSGRFAPGADFTPYVEEAGDVVSELRETVWARR